MSLCVSAGRPALVIDKRVDWTPSRKSRETDPGKPIGRPGTT